MKENIIEDRICNLFFAADNKSLVVCCSNEKVISMDIEKGTSHYEIIGKSHSHPIIVVLSSPNSKYVLSGTAKGDIKMWSLETF